MHAVARRFIAERPVRCYSPTPFRTSQDFREHHRPANLRGTAERSLQFVVQPVALCGNRGSWGSVRSVEFANLVVKHVVHMLVDLIVRTTDLRAQVLRMVRQTTGINMVLEMGVCYRPIGLNKFSLQHFWFDLHWRCHDRRWFTDAAFGCLAQKLFNRRGHVMRTLPSHT